MYRSRNGIFFYAVLGASRLIQGTLGADHTGGDCDSQLLVSKTHQLKLCHTNILKTAK